MTDTGSARRTTEQVVATLRDEILMGHLRGGHPVREQEIAQRLGVSRTPVREALARLVTEGLLVKDENKSAHVFQPSLQELLEIYEIRTPLESLSARIACEDPTPAYLERLRDAARALDAVHDLGDWVARHEDFHRALFESGRRPRLEGMVRTLRAQSEPYVRFAAADNGLRAKAGHDHVKLTALAEAGDGRGVEATVKTHLLRTTKHVTALLNNYQSAGLSLRDALR
ncbi:GntR family transcriptional regulator [Mycolicibacterium sp. P9-64]|nr:GntR family transcriptional regulator [Mycolicibacterium sp. P9-64]